MKKFLTSFALLTFALATQAVRAQDQQPQPPDPQQQTQVAQDSGQAPSDAQQPADSPADSNEQQPADAPGVARVSYISGNASSQRGDNGEWIALTVNTPLEPGDRISTGQGSRAEVQLNSSFVLRLSENATAKIATLTRNQIQVQVGQGLVTVAVLRGGDAGAEIDTPNVAIHPTAEGDYRIFVKSDAESDVIVRRGAADVTTPQGSTQVEAGQLITIQGTDAPEYKTVTAPAADNWDAWNTDRDNHVLNAESWHQTNRNYTGSEDLDNHGVWSEVPDYGRVWTPSGVGPDWAPYRDGRWVYEPYYGWTWVSYEPWGWAPYHYGRWFVYGGNWVWWPGPVGIYPGYYPVWSPAYVSFFGWGGGFGFGVGFGFGWGHVGWLPCGPGDWFHPWWGRWGAGFHAVAFDRYNSFHEGFGPLGRSNWHQYSNFNGAFRNDRIRNGISSMNGRDFGHGAVAAHQERISEATLRSANMSTGRAPMEPSRASYSPSNHEANPSTIRSGSSSSQHFFSASNRNNAPSSVAHSRTDSGNARASNRGSFSRPGNGSAGGNERGTVSSSRPGFHSFTPPASNGQNRANDSRGSTNAASRGSTNESRGQNSQPYGSAGASRSNGNPGGFRSFSAPSRSGNSGSYGGNHSYNRPSLNMRQPIVRPRGGSSYGYNTPRGNYSAPRGYSAPRAPSSAPRAGNSPAPRGGSAPRSYGAPRSSGGAPRGGSGGGHSGGGHSGGGSHGGGGGHHR